MKTPPRERGATGTSLWNRVRQRKLVQWAVAYLAGGWLVLQVLDVFIEHLGWPSWVFRVTVTLIAVGLLAILVLAWYHGDHGRQRVSGMEILMLAGIVVIAGGAFALVGDPSDGTSAESTDGADQDPAAASAHPDSVDRRPEIRSLAVLPLVNLSADPDQEYFTDGMTEALTAELGQISALTVVSRTSAMRYRHGEKSMPQIARELGVDGLIEGSVLRAGDEVRITLQLVHGPTDRHVWASSYQRDLRDILMLQADVARMIAREVRATVTQGEDSRLASQERVNADAYEAYLKGRYHFAHWGDDAFRMAIRYYEEALAEDSAFAPAHAALAEVLFQPPVADYERATIAAREAVALEPTLPEAQAALGIAKMIEWDWAGSGAAFQRAIELNPNSSMAHQWYAQLLRQTMQWDEALREARRAAELDPYSLLAKSMVGWVLFNQRRLDEALEVWEDVLELDPEFGLAIYNQGLAYALQGRGDDVISAARRARTAGTPMPDQIARWLLGVGHAVRGDRGSAVRILSELELERNVNLLGQVAVLRHLLGDDDGALGSLERAYDEHATGLPNIMSEPWLDGLRDHPRFRALSRSLGLRQASHGEPVPNG